jgi:hypothetical protein
LLEAQGNFGGEDRSGGRSENSDAVRLVGLEKFFVNGDYVIDRRGERILGGEAVIDGYHFRLR